MARSAGSPRSRRSYPEPDEPTVEEREVGERLTRNLCGGQAELLDAQHTVKPPRTLAIEIGLIHGSIDQVDELPESRPQIPPVDALAVGLYVERSRRARPSSWTAQSVKTFLERTREGIDR